MSCGREGGGGREGELWKGGREVEGREGGGREGELWKGGSEQVMEMETGVKDYYEHKDPNGGELPPIITYLCVARTSARVASRDTGTNSQLEELS